VDRANKVDGHEVRYSLVLAHFKCEPGGCRQPCIVHHRFNYDLQCPRVVRGSIRHLPNPLVTVRNSNHASPCNILLPPPHTPHTHFASQVDQVRKPTLAELLTIEPSASIFYGYTRELETCSDGRFKLTSLVPKNKVDMALARKPCVSFFLSFGLWH